jgi:hypothetical protein
MNDEPILALSLAEQIAQLEDTAPPDVDIERFDGGVGEEDGDNNDLAAGRGHYMDVGCVPLTLAYCRLCSFSAR